MWANPQLPGNLVTLTEEILNGKLHFLCSAFLKQRYYIGFQSYIISLTKGTLKQIWKPPIMFAFI